MRGQTGEDEPVVEDVGLVVAAVVGQASLQVEATALRQANAALVVGITFQMQAPGTQLGKSEVGNGVDGFGHVAVTAVGHVLPVANLKFGHLPIGVMQAAAADKRVALLEENKHGHIVAIEVTVSIAQDGGFGSPDGEVGPTGPGEPGGEVVFGLHDGVVERFAVAGARGADEQAFGFDGLGHGRHGLFTHGAIMAGTSFFGEWEVRFVRL